MLAGLIAYYSSLTEISWKKLYNTKKCILVNFNSVDEKMNDNLTPEQRILIKKMSLFHVKKLYSSQTSTTSLSISQIICPYVFTDRLSLFYSFL